MSFAQQVAVITGASSGIGRELARVLAADGARVGLVARRQPQLDDLAGQIRAAGGTAAVAAADVGDRRETVAAIRRIAADLGPVDLLVANAGVGVSTPLEPLTESIDEVERMVKVNLLGTVYALEAVLPSMLDRRRGHLAAISSLAGYKGLAGESGYCATKAAVNAYMEGLRIQLRGSGVAVTTVCPGFIDTPMTATFQYRMPFLMSAEQAARRIHAALRRRAAVYNFPWQTTLMVKATRWMPDWLVAWTMQASNIKPPLASRP